MQSDEVLAAHVRVAELMYVGHVCAGDCARRPIAPRAINETAPRVHLKHRLPHDARPNTHDAVRTVVIVDRRALPRSPTEHEQLDILVAKDAIDRKSTRLNS